MGPFLEPVGRPRPTLLSLKRQKWTHASVRPPKTPQEAAKTREEAAKTAQDAPQDPPRAPKHLPRPSKTAQNHPKMASQSCFVLLYSLLLLPLPLPLLLLPLPLPLLLLLSLSLSLFSLLFSLSSLTAGGSLPTRTILERSRNELGAVLVRS